MRALGVWGFGASLLLALGAGSVPAGDKDVKPPSRYGSKSVFDELFGPEEKKPAPKPAKDKEKARDAKAKDDAAPPRLAAADVREREEAKLLRRLEVCDRLVKIARDSGDADLERQAQQLDKRAWEVYRERTANLTGTSAMLEPDEGRLGKKLSVSTVDATRLTEGGSKNVARDAGGTAAVREVNP